MEEKRCFELLIGVSGVGPKAAQAILSASTPESLSLAVISGNERALTVAQGIGKKIAQRVILELKDKVVKGEGSVDNTALFSTQKNSDADEASTALVLLGFTKANVTKAVTAVLKEKPNATLEEIIKLALKKL